MVQKYTLHLYSALMFLNSPEGLAALYGLNASFIHLVSSLEEISMTGNEYVRLVRLLKRVGVPLSKT